MKDYQLAQINVAKMKDINISDAVMKEFVENLDRVNNLAEKSEGFVWRLKDESSNATNLNPDYDEQIIINISVWETIESLEKFVYKSFHTNFLKRRKEWLQTYGKIYTSLWWISKGQIPTLPEALDKLDHFEKNGASEFVFDFKIKTSLSV